MGMRYEKETDPFYKRAAWRRLRAAVLERDHHMCQYCLRDKRAGRILRVPRAVVVHHIKPRDMYPELAMEMDNLVSLCEACHNKCHPEKGGAPGHQPPEIPAGVRVIKV